jgi:hypothetical protein
MLTMGPQKHKGRGYSRALESILPAISRLADWKGNCAMFPNFIVALESAD